MEIVRVLHNNAAIVTDPSSDQQMVVLGKGIAHGRRRGEEIDPAAVDQTFVPDQVHPVEQLASYLSDIPLEVIRVSRSIAELAQDQLGLRLTQSLLLPIADHLAFANWQRAGRRSAQKPKRIPRPWEKPKATSLGEGAIPIANFNDWWDSQSTKKPPTVGERQHSMRRRTSCCRFAPTIPWA